jgi:hypothetical protein
MYLYIFQMQVNIREYRRAIKNGPSVVKTKNFILKVGKAGGEQLRVGKTGGKGEE